LVFGAFVGVGVGLRQQISAVPTFNVVEHPEPQPSQVTMSSRSPGLQPFAPMPHAVRYWTSPEVHGRVGLGVGLPQQTFFVPAFDVVEQNTPQPSQLTPTSRSPELQLPMPHAVWYWTSPEAHEPCCSRRRVLLEELFGHVGAAAWSVWSSVGPAGCGAFRDPSSMRAGARASDLDRFAASAERRRKGASRHESTSTLSSVDERSTASAQLESSPTRERKLAPTSVSATQPAP
jgi:hypothetical protein